MALAGTLWVNITANAAGLQRGIANANRAIAGFGDGIRGVGRRLTGLGDMLFNFAENFTQAMIAPVAALFGIAVYAASKTAEGKAEIDKLKKSWNELLKAMEPVGIVLLQMANVIMPYIVQGAQALSKWFTSLSKSGQWLTVIIMLFLAALGPLVMFFSAVIMLVGGLTTMFGSLFTPITLAIVAVMSFAAAMKYLWDTNEAFSKAVIALWGEIKNWWFTFFDPILQWCITNWPIIKGIITDTWKAIWAEIAPLLTAIVEGITWALESIRLWVETNWPKIRDTMVAVWEFIETAVTTIILRFVGLVVGNLMIVLLWVQENWPKIQQVMFDTWTWIETNVMPIVERIANGIIEQFTQTDSWFQTNWPKIKETFIGVWTDIKNFIWPLIVDMVTFIKDEWEKWLSWWEENGSMIVEACKETWENVKKLIKEIMGAIGPDLKEAWHAIKGVIVSVWEIIKSVISLGMEFIRMVITTGAAFITGDWEKAWNAIKSFFKTAVTEIAGFAQAQMNLLVSIVKIPLELMQALFKSIGETIVAGWKAFWGNVKSIAQSIDLSKIGSDIVNGLARGISNGVQLVKNAISKLAGLIPKWAKDMLGINSPSRVMMEIGDYTTKGMEVGMINRLSSLKKTADAMAKTAIPSIPKSPPIDRALTIEGNAPQVFSRDKSAAPIFNIQQLIVREEEDIRKIAQQLHSLSERGNRPIGGAIF